MMGEPFIYNRINMNFNKDNLTIDGKRSSYPEMNKAMTREMNEGRDITITEKGITRTETAESWEGVEEDATPPEERRRLFTEFQRALRRTVGNETMTDGQTLPDKRETSVEWATEVDGQMVFTGTDERRTMTDGQTTPTFPSPERMRSDGQTVDGQETGDRIGQETGQGQGSTTGQVIMTDERMIFTVTPDGLTLTDERTMTTDGQMTATTVVEEPLMAVEVEEPSMALEVDPLALSPAVPVMADDSVISHDSVVDTLSASPSPSRQLEHVVPEVDDDTAVDVQVEMDPLGCPLSSSFLSADEVVSSPVSGTPLKSVSATPCKAFLSPTESTPPSVSGPVRNLFAAYGVDMKEGTITRSRKVAGRKQPVVEDDEDSLSSTSVESVGWDSSVVSSSSKAQRSGEKRGVKRARKVSSDKDKDCMKKGKAEGSVEEIKKKGKGKKKEVERKETPEERDSCGPCGEPRGLVQHVLEDMSSAVLGAAIMEWANRIEEIRVKSKNFQGKLSGELKRCVVKIKEGTTLMGIRLEATGDPHFLRMRNAELASQLKEANRENARLEEQLRRMSSGTPSPLRKRKAVKTAATLDASQGTAVDLPLATESGVLSSLSREAFPPLQQRPPRDLEVGRGGDRTLSAVRASSPPFEANRGAEDSETGTEAYITQQIKALVAVRDLKKEKRRKDQGKEHVDLRDERKGVGVDKDREKDVGGKRQVGDGKVGPRIISNVQLVPSYKERLKDGASSSAVSASETGWRVVGGKRRRDSPLVRNSRMDPRALLRDAGVTAPPLLGQQPKPKVKVPRPPLSSAVTITGRVEGFSYAAAMKSARENIDLGTLGITTTRVRKALNGGILIEVSGEGSRAKAEELVTKLRGVLKDSAAVSCPNKKRELRVVGFDDSVSAEEITEELSKLGGCPVEDVKIGSIRTLNNGLCMVWVQLPVVAAAKVANEERVRLGWTVARVDLLDIRPLQCYRCWSYGHVQSTCRSVVDRREACFKCGQRGHMANKCQNAAHCVLCHEAGLETTHRLGGPQCMAREKK